MKSFFQKLISTIPLRPGIAIVFAIILGLLGIFLPSVYLLIHVKDSFDIVTSLTISRLEIFEVIDINDTWTCSSYLKGVNLPPYWLTDSIWIGLFRAFPLLVGMQYFVSFGSKKSQNALFLLIMLFLAFGFGFSALFSPNQITCSAGWEVTIYDYSISWFSFFVPIISLLIGTYAYQKRKIEIMEKPE